MRGRPSDERGDSRVLRFLSELVFRGLLVGPDGLGQIASGSLFSRVCTVFPGLQYCDLTLETAYCLLLPGDSIAQCIPLAERLPTSVCQSPSPLQNLR
jgi:hypothetical protein